MVFARRHTERCGPTGVLGLRICNASIARSVRYRRDTTFLCTLGVRHAYDALEGFPTHAEALAVCLSVLHAVDVCLGIACVS